MKAPPIDVFELDEVDEDKIETYWNFVKEFNKNYEEHVKLDQSRRKINK